MKTIAHRSILALAAAIFFVFLPMPTMADKAKPSPEMQAFLKERLIGEHDIDLSGLQKTDKPLETPEKGNSTDEVEVYQVPYPKQAADYFRYTVFREKVTNRFTVMKLGGIAGVLEFYELAFSASGE